MNKEELLKQSNTNLRILKDNLNNNNYLYLPVVFSKLYDFLDLNIENMDETDLINIFQELKFILIEPEIRATEQLHGFFIRNYIQLPLLLPEYPQELQDIVYEIIKYGILPLIENHRERLSDVLTSIQYMPDSQDRKLLEKEIDRLLKNN